MRVKALTILTGLLAFLIPLSAQVPAGYVQTTATVPALANGQFASSWTNLSPNPQLGLLGCVSTFQTTVSGRFDAYGHFAVPLADTAQICPAPSTWTFTFTFFCTPPSIPSAFTIQVPVTGGTEDISAQITARLPVTQCSTGGGGGGGGGGAPAPPAFAVQLANSSASAFQADPTITINPFTHTFSAPLFNFGHFDDGITLAGAVSTLEPLNNVATTYTPFAPARPFYTPAFGASDFGTSSPTTVLGIDNATRFGQGLTTTLRELFPLDGGKYTTQQMNQYSVYYGFLFNRSQGSNQLFGYGQYNLGRGDNVIQSGDQQCFGGGGREVGGLGTPACQFAQNFQSTGLNTFTATINGSGSAGQVTYTYTPGLNETSSAGARTIIDTSQAVNTGTATASGTTITFSGAPNMTTQNPSPVGQLIVLGSTADGYAPNLFGTAGGAAGTFQGFSNLGQVYAVGLGNSGGSGYNTGDQLLVTGCGSADALLNVIASGGVATGFSLAATPTGASGYSVASNCTTTHSSGSGTGATVNITQVTGVVGAAGQLCNVQNFSGGTGAQSTTGWFTGQLEFALTGTNAIANGTAFNGGGFKQPYDNVVNATAAQMVLATPTNAISAVCAGNIILAATSFPCQGDDVLISGICTGHGTRITKVLNATQVTVEDAQESRQTSGTAPNTPYVMLQSFELTNIDTTAHTFTAYGQMMSAVALTIGSSTTSGIYLLNGTGGLAGGHTCATPPTTPTSGNLQCAQIEVIINSLGQVSNVIPIVAGPAFYTSAPTFTMTTGSLNTGGSAAGCGGTCPTFQAFLDNNVAQYAWQNGDNLFQPPDWRVAMQEDQGIQTENYINSLSSTFQAESLGQGKIFAAFSTLGNSSNGLGGHKYYSFISPSDNNEYTFFMPGGTNPITGNPYKLQHSFFNFGGAFNSGDSFFDMSQLIAPAALNLVGGKWTSVTRGTGQPNATPAIFQKYTDAYCFAAVVGQCLGTISGAGNLNSTFGLSLAAGTPTLSGASGGISALFTDNVNGGFFMESLGSGANVEGSWFGNSGLKTLHSYTFAASTLFDAAQAQTTFPAIRLTGSQFLTSTDGTVAETQIVTKTPTGPIPANGVLPTTIYSAAGTPLPSCAAGIKGQMSVVSDATAPTYLGAYASGGAVVAPVMCNGSGWVTY